MSVAIALAGLVGHGLAARGDGFDGFVIPQRGSRPAVNGPVRTADASVLVPSVADQDGGQAFAPAPHVGADAAPWSGVGSLDSGGAAATCLDGTGAACGPPLCGTSGNACGDCSGKGCNACWTNPGLIQHLHGDACPRWVVQVDALMLWQANIASRPLLNSYAPTTMIVGPSALNANQAQPPMSAGPRVGLNYNFSQCHAIEGNYFQVRPFSGRALTGPGAFVENNLAGYTDTVIDSASLFTRASIQSAELNWRSRAACYPITWLAGFRWVEWDQQLHLDEVAAGGAFSSLFRTDTINNLYGGQLGMDLGLWTGSRFNVNGIGKAGVFLNHAAQALKYQDSSGFFDAVRTQADGTAFFGEIGVNGSLQLTPWLAWRLGYSLFWLSGVAVPANQLAVTNLAISPPTARLDANGSVLLHGATTGLEARW